MNMHNLDSIHGDEHLSEYSRDDIAAIERDFWETQSGVADRAETLLDLLAKDTQARLLVWDLVCCNADLISHRQRILDLNKRLRRIAESLVVDEIEAGNIRGIDDD